MHDPQVGSPHTDLKDRHWLPIKERAIFKILLPTYTALNDLSHSYIKDLLKCYTPARCPRSESNDMLTAQGLELGSYGRRAFTICLGGLGWSSRTVTLINSIKKHRHAKRVGVIFSIDWVAWGKTGC